MLGCSSVFLLVGGIALLVFGIWGKNIVIALLGIMLIVPFILWLMVRKKEKDAKKEWFEWLESNIDRDRICFKNIEPVYIKYAEDVTLEEFHKDYRRPTNQDIVTHSSSSGSNSSGGWVPNGNGGSTYVNMYGSSDSFTTTTIAGGYTQEFLDEHAEKCRKYKKLFFDENENVKAEIYQVFEGRKNKEFDDVIIEYIRNNDVVFD